MGRVVLTVVLGAVLLGGCGGGETSPEPEPVPDACTPFAGRAVPNEGAEHIPIGTPVEYASNPPASGPHATWLDWGIYRDEQPRERWVHNLEHGGVVLLYNCPEGCDADRDAIEAVARQTPKTTNGVEVVVVTPDSRMPKRIAVVAWDWLLELDTVDAQALSCFIALHRERAPERPF